MPLILAEELDTLTSQDVQQWDQRTGNGTRIYIDVIDKHKLTSERLNRLQSLVHESNNPSESRAVDADELCTKLQQITPRHLSIPSDTSTPSNAPISPITAGAGLTEEEQIEGIQNDAYENYEDLKKMGGRPSRRINPDPGPCPTWKSDAEKKYHVPDHWNGEEGRARRELQRWLDFKWYQFKMRENAAIYLEYEDAVHKFIQAKKISWTLRLQLDQQSKLDEWREYYIYEYRKRCTLQKELSRAKTALKSASEQMLEAKQTGLVGVTCSVWLKQTAEPMRYDTETLQAQKEIEMAQKRLHVLKKENLLSAIRKGMLIKQAEEELESAQKKMEVWKSDAMEQLNKEERTRPQAVLEKRQRSVDYTTARLTRGYSIGVD